MWKIFTILGVGIVGMFALSNKNKEKGVTTDFNYKKTDLPTKIRQYDKIKGDSRSRTYEILDKKTKKWKEVDYWEHLFIEDFGDYDEKTHYLPKEGKKRGKEGVYYIKYFVATPRSITDKYKLKK